jgi:hypothetical protein
MLTWYWRVPGHGLTIWDGLEYEVDLEFGATEAEAYIAESFLKA